MKIHYDNILQMFQTFFLKDKITLKRKLKISQIKYIHIYLYTYKTGDHYYVC